MPASLKDVALLAGVSIKTVSNVVNGYQFVSEDTRARVSAALEQLQYRPNMSARGLRTGRSDLIALAVPTLDEPYFGEIASLIVDEAARVGLTVLINQTGGKRARERDVGEGQRANLMDGAILSPMEMTDADVSQLAAQRPTVLLGERLFRTAADHVAVDSVAAAYDATRHLVELGRTTIAFIGAEPSIGTSALRLEGYKRALSEAGRKPPRNLVYRAAPFHRTEGAEAARALLARRNPPDAIFCVNDLLALGAVRAVLDAGLRVPEDVAVIGFDDIEDGRFGTPTLSTVRPDKKSIAEIAVERIRSRILDKSEDPPRDIVAGHTLELRESTLGTGASTTLAS